MEREQPDRTAMAWRDLALLFEQLSMIARHNHNAVFK